MGYKSNTVDVLTKDEYVDFVTNSLGNQDAIDALTDDETDWQEEIYRPAFGTDNNLTVSQGLTIRPTALPWVTCSRRVSSKQMTTRVDPLL